MDLRSQVFDFLAGAGFDRLPFNETGKVGPLRQAALLCLTAQQSVLPRCQDDMKMVSFFDFSHFVLLPAALPRYFRSQAALGTGAYPSKLCKCTFARCLRQRRPRRRWLFPAVGGAFFER